MTVKAVMLVLGSRRSEMDYERVKCSLKELTEKLKLLPVGHTLDREILEPSPLFVSLTRYIRLEDEKLAIFHPTEDGGWKLRHISPVPRRRNNE